MNISKNIKQLACGILYNTTFKLLDSWGEIVDTVIYKDKNYFSSDFFPSISQIYTTERSLTNSKGHELRLSSNSLIFTQSIDNENYESEYSIFTKRVSEFLIPHIISKYDLVIRRIGMVYFCKLNSEEISDFAKLYFVSHTDGIRDFRFSKKESTIEGHIFKNKSDYINKIFTVGGIKQDMTGLSYDFQYHYVPPKVDIRDEIRSFFEKSNRGFNQDIVEHFNDKNGI